MRSTSSKADFGGMTMAVFFIVNIEIPDKNDRDSYDDYISKVKPIIESYGGSYIVRSEQVELVSGEQKPDRIIVIRFENKKQLQDCFASDAYISVKKLRESSVKATAFIVEQ